MSLLLPLGLMGLISLLALLLIYILKPNYQQKYISSTYVWKLSLKYTKKRIPVSRLRNILLILCQVLILCGASFLLAHPMLVNDTTVDKNERIIVVDASASMLAEYEGETRFDRAISKAESLAEETLSSGGIVTVIYAGREASYVAQRIETDDAIDLNERLAALECTYGEADIEGAMSLAEQTMQFNTDAEIVFYTATQYLSQGEIVQVVDVSEASEWNAAILNATAVVVDNRYVISVDLACYGADKSFELYCEVKNANGTSGTVSLPVTDVYCSDEETQTVVYTVENNTFGKNVTPVILTDDQKIYSFEQIYVYIEESDSYYYDNEFYIYGGERPTVKVLYYSTDPNSFFPETMLAIQSVMKNRWNIDFKQVDGSKGAAAPTEGYDFYIFEHTMPTELPTDGVVFMADPDRSAGGGFTLEGKTPVPNWSGDGATLAPGAEHPILNYLQVEQIRITEYARVNENSLDGYDVLMYYEGNPVFFVRNDAKTKIAVLAFSINKSTLADPVLRSVLMSNMFEYYFPATVQVPGALPGDELRFAFDVYDTVNVQARGEQMTIIDPDSVVQEPETLPCELNLLKPGTYTLTQTIISDAVLSEQIYVRIPQSQSNIKKTEDLLAEPNVERTTGIFYEDILVYVAAAVLALLFLEYWLQSRSGN